MLAFVLQPFRNDQLALGNALTSAVWELVQSRGVRVHFQDVQDFVVAEFERHLDGCMLSKARLSLSQL